MQLTARLGAFALIGLTSATALAQERDAGDGGATSKVSVYADDDATTVVTTAVDAEVIAPGSVALGAYFLVDSVSSASVDVVSAATERWTENRIELGARAGIDLGRVTGLTLSYSHSHENDWSSHTISASGRRELGERNTTLTAGYAAVFNRVGRADDPTFERSLDAHSLQLGVSQLWSRVTLFGLTYNVQRTSGYQASPYRYARITGSAGELDISVPEAHPETRIRHALSARHLRAIARSLALESTYRFYVDDWGILSHTIQTALTYEAASWIDLRARARGYLQTSASFYADSYEQLQRFATSDRELGEFWNLSAGLKSAFYVGSFVLDLKLEAIHYRFAEFERLPRRNAVVGGAGARVEW